MDKVFIEDMSWAEFGRKMVSNDLIIFPTGSTEAHGPHNPLGTDTFIAKHVAEAVGMEVDAPVAPAVPLGNARTLAGFPGTTHIDPSILCELIFGVCESLVRHGARRFLFINGHGGNADSLRLVASDLYDQYGVIATNTEWWTALPHITDLKIKEHGGRYETSLAMVAAGEFVDLERAPSEPEERNILGDIGVGEYEGAPVRFPLTLDQLFPSGFFGPEVQKADRRSGEEIMTAYIQFCVALARELRKVTI